MPNPHPFYRFKTAWNAGFYPDNQIVSNLQNDLYVALGSWLSGYWPGLTINQLYSGVKVFVSTYNAFPNFGDFEVTIQKIADSPNYEYNINIFNADLSAVDSSQIITINGFFNPTTQLVVGAALLSYTVGAYSGTFDASPIPVEAEVANSIIIADQYGSAIFPLTYSYNSGTNIATSGLARGKNWTINSNGEPTRVPVLANPMQNAKRFTLPAQTGEETYIVTFLERIIQTSLIDTNYLTIQDTYNSLGMPDGWTKTWSYVSATYDRIQINCVESVTNNAYTMVGRLDGEWLWQRFVRVGGSPGSSNFLTAYSDTTPLPYNTDSGSSYLYFSAYYDFDFCDFVDSCYVSPEFYPMPAKPGDTWQFNVNKVDANLTGLESVKIGLFQEDGGFVQKIGDAIDALTGCCVSYVYRREYTEFEFNSLRLDINAEVSDPPLYTFGLYAFNQEASTLAYSSLQDIPLAFLTTASEFAAYINTLSITGYTLSCVINPDDTVTVTFESSLLPCVIGDYNVNFQIRLIDEAPFDYPEFEKISGGYQVTSNKDFNASCTIPAVANGCYRLGLYQDTEESGSYLYSLSNIIKIDTADCFSTMLEYWGNTNTIAQSFEYYNNWKQRVRLGINGGGHKPVIEESLYRQSNGVHKRPQNKQDLSIDLHTDFFDLDTQLALTDATRHPNLVWNNQSIFVKGDIDVATIQDFTTQSSFETLSQMKFQALKQGFQPRNSSCLTC
jgi:hypothetical protein